MNKRAKIQDVARVAGVSTATVSRALTSPNLVTETTKKAVMKAVEETGYRPNRAARNLRTRRSGAILIMVPSLGNPFFSEILSGLERVCAEAGYNVLISDTFARPPSHASLRGYFEDGQADGIIILDGQVDGDFIRSLKGSGFENRIVYACEWPSEDGYPSVRSDNAQGVDEAIEYLVGLGHHKIAHVCGPENNVLSQVREAAFRKAVEDRGLTLNPNWMLPGTFTLQAGRQAAQRLLELEDQPTAIVCASDQIAYGVVSRFNEAQMSVPGDFSVVGFDDIEMSGYFSPPLTTVRQDRDALGSSAARLLLGRLQETAGGAEGPIIVPVSLIKRASAGPPRAES